MGDQVGVLADPAEPGLFGQRLFQHRGAVAEGPVLKRPHLRFDALGQFLQARAHEFVIIPPERITRNEAPPRVVHDGLAVGGLSRQVIQARGDHAQRAGLQLPWPAAARAVGFHIMHFAMAPAPEPAQQAGFGLAEIGVRDADFLKTQFSPPGFDVGGESGKINIVVPCGMHRGLS